MWDEARVRMLEDDMARIRASQAPPAVLWRAMEAIRAGQAQRMDFDLELGEKVVRAVVYQVGSMVRVDLKGAMKPQ